MNQTIQNSTQLAKEQIINLNNKIINLTNENIQLAEVIQDVNPIVAETTWMIIAAMICSTIIIIGIFWYSIKTPSKKGNWHPAFIVFLVYALYILIVIVMLHFQILPRDFNDEYWWIHLLVLFITIGSIAIVYFYSKKKSYDYIEKQIQIFLQRKYNDDFFSKSKVGSYLEGFREYEDRTGKPKAEVFVNGNTNDYTFTIDMLSGDIIGCFRTIEQEHKDKVRSKGTPEFQENKVETAQTYHSQDNQNDGNEDSEE